MVTEVSPSALASRNVWVKMSAVVSNGEGVPDTPCV